MAAYPDASALLPSIVRESFSAAVDDFLLGWRDELIIGEFAAAEVASALSRLVRTGRLEADDALARLADFDAWRAAMTTGLDVQGADVRLAGLYVRRFALKLRAPDALHAATCRRLGLVLVTLDHRLAAAARELGVTVQVPAA